MICKNCSAESPDNQRFCGSCGAKTRPESLEEVQLRLACVEKLVDKQAQATTTDQKFLDVDTTEKVATRLMNWAKLFAFFVGIPFALFLLIATLYVGKSFTSLNELAGNARESVKPVLNEARSTAENAERTASDALGISQEVSRSVESTKSKLSELQKDIGKGSEQVQQLAAHIREAQSAVSALRMKATEGSNEIKRLSQQIERVAVERSTALIRDGYPTVFGERVAWAADGPVIPKSKRLGELFISFGIASGEKAPSIGQEKIGQVMSSLKNRGHQVFVGYIGVQGRGEKRSQWIHYIQAEDWCGIAAMKEPPCVLYFRTDLKEAASATAALLAPAQTIAADKVCYLDPSKAGAEVREVLERSGLDLAIVLDAR
jgi:hypothetical protein